MSRQLLSGSFFFGALFACTPQSDDEPEGPAVIHPDEVCEASSVDLAPDDAQIGFSADDVIAAEAARPVRAVAWTMAPEASPVVATWTCEAPRSVRAVTYYVDDACAPGPELVFHQSCVLDIDDGGIVASLDVETRAPAPDAARITGDSEAVTLDSGRDHDAGRPESLWIRVRGPADAAAITIRGAPEATDIDAELWLGDWVTEATP